MKSRVPKGEEREDWAKPVKEIKSENFSLAKDINLCIWEASEPQIE